MNYHNRIKFVFKGETTLFCSAEGATTQKLSGKRALNKLTLERRLSFTEGVNLSGKQTDWVMGLI